MEQTVSGSSFGRHPITGQQFLEIDAGHVMRVEDSEGNRYTYEYHMSEKILYILTPIPKGTTVTIEFETKKFF